MARDPSDQNDTLAAAWLRGVDRVRSAAHGLSKVDAALLVRRLLFGERVNSASGDGSLRVLPAGLKSVSADQNFELSLSSLRTRTPKSHCCRLSYRASEGYLRNSRIEDRASGK